MNMIIDFMVFQIIYVNCFVRMICYRNVTFFKYTKLTVLFTFGTFFFSEDNLLSVSEQHCNWKIG